MHKLYIAFMSLIIIAASLLFQITQSKPPGQPLSTPTEQAYRQTVVLIPLDSRPACTSLVIELAHMAGIKLILPPERLLDNYKLAADTNGLREWLKQAVLSADAAIVSIDMLAHGGLLASRQSISSSDDINELIDLLTEIRNRHPQLPIHAFNIIPRLLISNNEHPFQYSMMEYSILKDQVYTFENPLDIQMLNQLEQQLPGQVIHEYEKLYRQNTALSTALIRLVDNQVLTSLILGQDDGQPFGLPNIAKRKLEHLVKQRPERQDKIFITKGADEVAMTIVGRLGAALYNYRPNVFVVYSSDIAREIVMPYMPHSVATSVKEKLDLMGAHQVNTIDQADFVLFVHIGSSKTSADTITAAAAKIKQLIDQNYQVAVIDLSYNFTASETVLPLLIQQHAQINKLIAYAGWNTTSNSLGTALTQATLFSTARSAQQDTSALLLLYKLNLEFVTARFLDDWYYLKQVQPQVNEHLQNSGINPYQLGRHYGQTSQTISSIMHNKSRQLLHSTAFNQPFAVATPQGPVMLAVTGLQIQTYVPWERTFEIYLKPEVGLTVQ